MVAEMVSFSYPCHCWTDQTDEDIIQSLTAIIVLPWAYFLGGGEQ
jgi:hypothetical protein